MDYIGYCDGGCNNIEKINAYGSFKIFKEEELVEEEHFKLGDRTNNEAEYLSFILLMDALLKYKEFKLKIYSDSSLMLNQTLGIWKVKSVNLIPLCKKAQDLLSEFNGNLTLEWVSRKEIVKVLGH